jgi:acyl carrier protein
VSGQGVICLHGDSTTQLPNRVMALRPTVILDAVEEFRITQFATTATMIGRILNEEGKANRLRNLASLRTIGVGGEPIAVRLVQDFTRLLRNYGVTSDVLGSGYGTTETGALVNGSRDFQNTGPSNSACLGPPRAGVRMRIVGEDRSVVGSGQIGELEVSCPEKMFSGYWSEPDLTREGFSPDGWWKTGDLGQLIDGQLYLHGRAKEVFIQAGKKFSFADIDDEMRNSLQAGDVAHAFTVSRPGEPEELAVVFAVCEPSRAEGLAEKIRTAVARRFGILPGLVFETEPELIPRTAAGKLRRGHLNSLLNQSETIHSGNASDGRAGTNNSSSRDALEAIWYSALGIDGPVAPRTNFFDSGGDSLRSLSLHHQISEGFGVNISAEEFASDPTFEALVTIVEKRRSAPDAIGSTSEVAWPLPTALRNDLLAALETWQGERPTKSRMVLAFNRQGTKPPLFWVFNTSLETRSLAKALGDDQPLYAFRSGWLVTDYREDHIQALALRYLSEIIDLYPEGPFFIGGNCQGGVIALAIAQHALRRKRHVPFLVLMDWTFTLQPYQGHVLLVSGRDNFDYNPVRRFESPELAWRRAFSSFEFVEIPGGYAQGFDEGPIEVLTDLLTSRMQSALQNPPAILPETAYCATIEVHDVPLAMETSGRMMLKVVVRQDSPFDWNRSEQSGIVLGSRWLDANGRPLQRSSSTAVLPRMARHSSVAVDLAITAPDDAGDFTLNIELREEGNRWFRKPEAGFRTPISIVKSNRNDLF